MNASLSEYLFPLIFFATIVLISLRKGIDKKKAEEMAKTMLPGHTSGEVITTWAPDPTVPVQKTVKKPQSTAFKPERPITDFPVEPAVPTVKDNEEDSLEPILNIEDVDDIKKAVIYTEIFSRKNF